MDKHSTYLRGVAVGLIAAWVVSAIAYLGNAIATYSIIIEFEVVLSLILLVLSYVSNSDRKRKRR
ncbi:MAG: hypothetical protein KGH94_04030 [Candidatus Micrarchaeota archaeon]|nr:hypothetical protein [Candidatus Micrarchaeota archaeon]